MKTQQVSVAGQNGTPGALRSCARRWIGYATKEHTMKKIREVTELDEPLGIIISRGDPAEQRPVFWGYIWAPAPELDIEAKAKVA
jgi:hypothetical protein